MIRYIKGRDLCVVPRLRDSMFRDRAIQFRDRLGWAVTVDDEGFERDEYDALDPLYVIWSRPGNRHGGSMRFLPTTGRTMVNDHFTHLTDGVRIASPFIWECTRFCLADDAPPRVAAALMLAGLEFGLAAGLSHAVGVFDRRMVRIYRGLGWSPAILGGDGDTQVGLWAFEAELLTPLRRRAHVAREVSSHWVRRGFADEAARAA